MSAFIDKCELSRYTLHKSKSSLPVPLIEIEEDQFFHMEDWTDPFDYYSTRLPNISGNKFLFLIFGLGMGYQLRKLIQKSPESRFIVLEHDAALFKIFLQAAPQEDLICDERVEFSVGLNEPGLMDFFQSVFHSRDFSQFLPAVEAVTH